MLRLFTPVTFHTEERPTPPLKMPYGRWPANACPRPKSAAAIAAHNERRLVIWRRRSREMLVVYDRHELNVTESGVKCVDTQADPDNWYDWRYYQPQVGDVLGWQYVNRSEEKFEVVGVYR